MTAKQPIARVLQPFVDSRTLAGAVMLVAGPDHVLSFEAVGYSDVAAKTPIADRQPLLDCFHVQTAYGHRADDAGR